LVDLSAFVVGCCLWRIQKIHFNFFLGRALGENVTHFWFCHSFLGFSIKRPAGCIEKIEIFFVSLLTYISNKQLKMTGIEAIVVGLVMVVGGGQLEEWLEHQNYKMAVARNRSPPPNRLRWFG